MDKSTNAVAYAPGYYIRDILTTLNISYNDFAQKMDMNLDEVTQLILGECELNEEIAKKLEAFFHVDGSRWLTLEKAISYDQRNDFISFFFVKICFISIILSTIKVLE